MYIYEVGYLDCSSKYLESIDAELDLIYHIQVLINTPPAMASVSFSYVDDFR